MGAGDEKEEPKADEEKKEEEKPPVPVILSLDLHCVGCSKKIERTILRCRGVEGVEMDMGSGQVTVKGLVDPEALCARIKKRTRKQVRVISPPPPADGESKLVASQIGVTTTVELQVNMHCEACAQHLRRKILKMRGVQTAEMDLISSKVIVNGTMDADRLVDHVYRHTRKQATVIPQPPKEEETAKEEPAKPPENESTPEEKPVEKEKEDEKEEGETKEEAKEEEEKQETEPATKEEKPSEGSEGEAKKEEEGVASAGGEDENAKKMTYYWTPIYVIERPPPAPQLFSDENPNACSIS